MIPFYETFYNIILTSANSVPIQSLWVAFFTNPVDLNRATQAGLYENGYGYFSVAPGAAINTAQGINGALFANAVNIPGDGMTVSKVGPEGMGLIKGNISSGRNDMEELSISFLDTNMSFCDYNLRPWVIYANHRSLKDPAVKTTITILQLAKSGSGKPLMPRAIWTFHDACPISISSQEWNYGNDAVVNRTVKFAYNYYLLNADPLITPAKAVASVLKAGVEKYKSQPVEVRKGGLTGHKSAKTVKISGNDSTSLQSHPEGQLVDIPDDDMVSRGVNIGLDILNGNSNVLIDAHDMIERLKGIANDINQKVEVPFDDVPQRSKGLGQIGHIEKQPVGPEEGIPDHITRDTPEREQSGRVPVGGNSKANAKGLSDTPLFFPGDGDEAQKKIAGRSVDGELDTPEILTIKSQEVEIPVNGNVGRNIPLQIINIKRNDARNGGKTSDQFVSIDPFDATEDFHGAAQIVTIDRNDATTKRHSDAQIVTIPTNDDAQKSYGTAKVVTIKSDDTTEDNHGRAKLVTINSGDTSKRSSIPYQEVKIVRNPESIGSRVQGQIVKQQHGDNIVSGSHATAQIVDVSTQDHIGEFKTVGQRVEVKGTDTVSTSDIKAKIVDTKPRNGRR